MAPKVPVWDLPTRLGHWIMVGLFVLSWWSAEQRMMDRHYLFGLSWVALLAFRLIWGLVGTNTSRFRNFVRSPAGVIAHLRQGHEPPLGHSPLGAYNVIAMLLALTVQITSGLFATDVDGLDSGPLSFLLSFDQARLAAKIHAYSFNVLLGLIALHIAAIVFYLVFARRNLVGPMISGRTRHAPRQGGKMVAAGPIRFAAAAAIAVVLAWQVGKGFGL
ncbi:cytochrome b/b6 domain-containing protein [Novosphingobium sp. ZW T3_23]|uniref:cytochrome b/b6 domain-containing protein n=1 Tax=Novosphingobium sp. ZW T3_23 TaxID=3378084 RepID=UPI0038520620